MARLVLALVEVALVLLRPLLLEGDAVLLFLARQALAVQLLLAIAFTVLLPIDPVADVVGPRVAIAQAGLLRITLGGGDARIAFGLLAALCILAAGLGDARLFGALLRFAQLGCTRLCRAIA
jgi:hypothetical protein